MAGKLSRRLFLGVTAGAAAAASGGSAATTQGLPDAGRMKDGSAPWFLRTRRWVQTNLNEQDPSSYDAALWSDYWERVRAQGVIVNAGGIVAFYPRASSGTTAPWRWATGTSLARSARPRGGRASRSSPAWTRRGRRRASSSTTRWWYWNTRQPIDASRVGC